MEQHRKDLKKESTTSAFQILDKMHPHKVYLYIGIMCSVFILFSMLVAYMISKPEALLVYQYYIPKSFIVSSFILGLSVYYMSRVLPCFRQDDVKSASRFMGVTLMLTLIYSLFQMAGYRSLTAMGVFGNNDASVAYLYVISTVYFILLLGGIIGLTVLYVNALNRGKDVVKTLIMVTTPYERIKLEMLVTYWYFFSVAWTTIFLFFLMLY